MTEEEFGNRLQDPDYNSIFNAANDAILVYDIENYGVVDANRKACEMFCYPREEMSRLTIRDMALIGDSSDYVDMASYAGKAAAGEPQLFEWQAKDKAGRSFWVEVNLKRAVIGGKYRLIAVVRDINDRKHTESLLAKINEVFLSFSADSQRNINLLTALCGELMSADCVLYNRIEGDYLYSCGQWNIPDGFNPSDKAEGHICTDVIRGHSEGIVVIANLSETSYAKTDPNISAYGLKTYVGYPVRFGDNYIGTICALYKRDHILKEDDKRIIGIIASAIGVEEERKNASEISQIAQFSIDRASELILWAGKDSRILYVNEMTCHSVGYSREELLEMNVSGIDSGFSHESWDTYWADVKEKGVLTIESRIKRKDGSTFPVEVNVNYLEFQNEEYVCIFARNISERKTAGETLLKRDYQLEILSRTSQHINAILEVPVIMRTLVAAAIELVEASAGAAGLLENGKIAFTEYNKGGHIERINYPFEEGRGAPDWIIQTKKPYIANDAERDSRILPEKTKKFGLYNLVCVPILSGSGDILGCFEIYNKKDSIPFDSQDVFMLQGLAASASVALSNAKMLVEVRSAEAALRDSERRYRLAAENMPLLLAAVDLSGKFTMWNKYAENMLGYTPEEVIGNMRQSDLHDAEKDAKEVMELAARDGLFDKEVKLVHKKGNIIYAHLVVVPYRDSDSKIIGFYGFAEDITKRRRAEADKDRLNEEIVKSNKRLKQLSLKDVQTGLYNHHYLNEVIGSEFDRARRYGHSLSVMMLDIDYLKSINEVYGYDFGDLVLKQLAKQLTKLVRGYDIVIRFGGGEFVVVSPAADREKAVSMAQRLLDAINLYNFGDRKHSIKLKLSIAVSSYPEDSVSDGTDLVNLADSILRKAKEAGGNRVWSSADTKRSGRAATAETAAEINDVKVLKEKIEKLTKRGKQSLTESIFAFAKTIELKDHGTGEHVERTVRYATTIAKEMGLSGEEMENIRQGAILHDLGKIGISDNVLLKKTQLTKKEFDEIKKHPQIAADIIRPIQFMHDIIPLILYHHEHWDGKGYPAGLKGEEIPIGARIISIADVYQALTSNRPYRKAFRKKEAMQMIKENSGTQFDPTIVDIFLKVLKREK